MSNLDIKFKRLTPFKRCVLQNFPFIEADFDALTNYGLLCKIVEYLNNVIASQNEVQGVTEETVAAFNNLYDYVHDYFDNLDVQEEINNKLDEMTEDGTLQEIIASYLQANVAWTFDTVADMQSASNLVNGSYAQTLGYYSVNDGGAALYKITDTGTADGGSTIAVGDLFAHLVIEDSVSVKQFGAKGDGTTDDTDSIQLALNACKKVTFTGDNYFITSSLTLQSDSVITGDNTKLFSTNDYTGINVFSGTNLNNVEISGFKIEGTFRATNIESSDNIYIHNMIISTYGWGMLLKLTNNFKIENITFNQIRTSTYSNKDGVHINGGKHGLIKDIYGTTDDDMIALNADESAGLIGEISDVIVDHVVTFNSQEYGATDSTYRGIKILSRGSLIDKITIQNCVIASDYEECVYICRDDADTSNIGSVLIRNCWFKKNHVRNISVITADTSFENLTVQNCTLVFKGGSGSFYNQAASNTFGNVLFDNVKYIDEHDSEHAYMNLNGTINHLTVSNVKVSNVTPYQFVSIRSVCNDITLENIYANNAHYVLTVISAGTAGTVNISNVNSVASTANYALVNIAGKVSSLNINNATVDETYVINLNGDQTALVMTGNNIYHTKTKMINDAGHTSNIRLRGMLTAEFTPDTAGTGDTFIYKSGSTATMKIYSGGAWVDL